MAGDTFEVDTDVIRDAAVELARRARDATEHRAHVRWPGVQECGSPAVSEAVDEVADWYLASWARVESGLVWLAEVAAAAAEGYAGQESAAKDEFRS